MTLLPLTTSPCTWNSVKTWWLLQPLLVHRLSQFVFAVPAFILTSDYCRLAAFSFFSSCNHLPGVLWVGLKMHFASTGSASLWAFKNECMNILCTKPHECRRTGKSTGFCPHSVTLFFTVWNIKCMAKHSAPSQHLQLTQTQLLKWRDREHDRGLLIIRGSGIGEVHFHYVTRNWVEKEEEEQEAKKRWR